MPDISMCANQTCPSRLLCYRYTAQPSEWQPYQEREPGAGQERCEDYWDNTGRRVFRGE